jgi:hypothetical protein
MTAPSQTSPAEVGVASLDDFFARVCDTNPFTDNRVNGPSEDDIDVDAIHQAAFERLVALAQEAQHERRGLGAVLWGEPGIGKSHVLSRLSRWAERARKYPCFVYLHNLQAAPDHLPRSLLQATLSSLTRGRVRRLWETTLFRLTNAAVREALRQAGVVEPSWQAAEASWNYLVEGIQDSPRSALVDRTIYEVLFRFFTSAYLAREQQDDERVAGLAVRWLSGDYLDPTEAAELHLPPGRSRDEPVALADNQPIKQVLVALTQMALWRGQPFLLCFDQVDNLDRDQVGALARFLEALIDSAANLLVVTSGVQATLMEWLPEKVIQESAWHRVAQFEIALQRVTVPEATGIVAARLERFLEPFHELDPVRQRLEEDPLFPLGRPWLREFLEDKIAVRPRDVINWAREGWRREQEAMRRAGGPAWLAAWGGGFAPPDGEPVPWSPEQIRDAIDRKVAQKMAEQKALRQAQPESLPPDADNLAGLVFALLEQCWQAGGPGAIVDLDRPRPAKAGQPPLYQLVVAQGGAEDQRRCTGLLFLATSSAISTAGFLRRLLQDPQPPQRVLLVSDERRPLPIGARGQEYLEQLRYHVDSQFQHIELTFAEYADLDALQATVGLARSGDLEIELPSGQSRRVSEKEAIESHHRQGRYPAAPLLREVLNAGPEAPAPAGPAPEGAPADQGNSLSGGCCAP